MLSIAGLEYAFTTSGVSTLPTCSDGDYSNLWTVLESSLDWTDGVAWSVRARSDGSLESGSLTFTLHDVVPATGSAAGKNVCTYLFTRRPSLIGSSRLAVSAGASGATIEATSIAALGLSGYPATIYVDREAVGVVSDAGDDISMNVAGGTAGRGRYGSLATSHTVDAANLVYPTVWGALPTITRRKAILWAVDDTNAATAIWRGNVGVGPSLHADGAAFDIQCEGIWTQVANQRIGTPNAIVRFAGYWGGLIGMNLYRDGAIIGIGGAGGQHYRTLAAACAGALRSLTYNLVTNSVTDVTPTLSPYAGGIRGSAVTTSGSNLQVEIYAGSQRITSNSTGTAGARYASATIARVPAAILRSANGTYENYFPVDGLTDLPVSWSSTVSAPIGGFTTTVQQSLVCEYGSEWAVFAVASSGNNTSAARPTWFLGPYIRGNMSLTPRDGTDEPALPPSIHEVVAEGELKGTLSVRVNTGHFAVGLRYLLDSATAELRSSIDVNDWEWSVDATALPRIIAATSSGYAERIWYIDGSQTAGDITKEICATNGLGLCLRGSRLAVVVIGPATRATTVAATLTEADLVDNATWQAQSEEQITALKIESSARNLVVQNRTAENTYGPGRTVTAKLEGQSAIVRAMANYQDFVRYMLSRLSGPYAEPIAAVTIKVAAASWLTTIKCGDYIDLSEWLAPAGDGTRGVGNATALAAFATSTQRAQVVGWDPDLRPTSDGGTLTLTCLLFTQVAGYAPACKVASTGSTTTVTVATGFITAPGGVTGDYSSPDVAAADGGSSKFAIGDRVQFRKMNITTDTVFGPYTVQNVSGTTVTFTGAIDAGMRIAITAGDWYDLEYADLSDVVGGANESAQAGYAFCGNATTGVIGSTTYGNQTWAP